MKNMSTLLRLVAVMCALGAVLASPAFAAQAASPFAPYHVPPHVPPPATSRVASLLAGSSVTAQGGWIVARLKGSPYRIGFQNGYLTAQSSHFYIRVDLGTPRSHTRAVGRMIAKKFVWRRIPREYRQELRGIAAGMQAAGYHRDTLWDVVAANDWADQDCYAQLSHKTSPTSSTAFQAGAARHEAKGGCSAFIATGSATTDGRPVMGHNTWSPYDQNFMYNVMFYVQPQKGYDFSYQAAGGQIWSGQDWYENSAGLLLTETSLWLETYDPKGTPVFVRARKAAQYASTVGRAIHTLRAGNNGAYSNQWLIGDASGEIACLQLGCKAYDLNRTRNGFYGCSNFDWGPNTRAEEGPLADPYKPAEVDYARYLRWGQLKAQYYGQIDVTIGKTMESDTYDSYLGTIRPDARTLCGEAENYTPGLLAWDWNGPTDDGAYDGKVCTESMALDGLQVWARWGHPNGDPFSATGFLAAHPNWASRHGALAVFGLRTFAAQTPNPWVVLKR